MLLRIETFPAKQDCSKDLASGKAGDHARLGLGKWASETLQTTIHSLSDLQDHSLDHVLIHHSNNF